MENFQILHARSWPFSHVLVARVWRNFFSVLSENPFPGNLDGKLQMSDYSKLELIISQSMMLLQTRDLMNLIKKGCVSWRSAFLGGGVAAPDLKSGGPGFKSRLARACK